jgi:hypothetical protein
MRQPLGEEPGRYPSRLKLGRRPAAQFGFSPFEAADCFPQLHLCQSGTQLHWAQIRSEVGRPISLERGVN